MQFNTTSTPVFHSQALGMRNNLPESEPLSEYSEMQMLPMQMTPMQTTPMQMQFNMMSSQSKRMPDERQVSGSSSFPKRIMMNPTQNIVPQYNHEQRFAMQSVPMVNAPLSQQRFVMQSAPMINAPLPQQRFVMSVPKANDFPAKKSMEDQRRAGIPPPATITSRNKDSTKSISQGGKFSIDNIRFFVGSIDQVVRWNRMAKQAHIIALFEVSGVLERMFFNSLSGVYNMTVRDEKRKVVPLQVSFYRIDRNIPKVVVGQLITCVGRMMGANKLQAYNIWPATSDSLIGIQRTSNFCQRALLECDPTST